MDLHLPLSQGGELRRIPLLAEFVDHEVDEHTDFCRQQLTA
jgi:hypothetical protein